MPNFKSVTWTSLRNRTEVADRDNTLTTPSGSLVRVMPHPGNVNPATTRPRSLDGAFVPTFSECHALPNTSSSSRTTIAFNVAKITLSLAESIAEAVPIAGDPLKAAVGGILKILDLFDVRDFSNAMQHAR